MRVFSFGLFVITPTKTIQLMKSTTHYAAAELARRRKHYQTLVNEGLSAEDIVRWRCP